MLRTSFCDRKCCCFVLLFCLGFLTRKLYDQTDENKVYIGNNSAFAVTVLEDVLPNKLQTRVRQRTLIIVLDVAFKTNIYIFSCGQSLWKSFELMNEMLVQLQQFSCFRVLCFGFFHLSSLHTKRWFSALFYLLNKGYIVCNLSITKMVKMVVILLR